LLGGRYRLEKILGKGATGVVFEASHLVIGKRVALKCLYPHHRAAANAIERFFREARIAATVEHPNVIQVFDGGDEKETLFLAMELL
ncbi:MAG TPA: serine/threonine protein kinase, partial [Myxococcales bacterium]|nr:serine/threonine protein kinase [Myxococcales bacterium]